MILSGCRSPMVTTLRPDKKSYHIVVGIAHVPGVMRGEAVEEDTKWVETRLI